MRTLYLDIESSPNVAHVWQLFKTTVSLAQLRESAEVMCFAAKWRGEKRTRFYSTFHNGRGEMVKAAHGLLADADIVVGYNQRRFDVPMLNREFERLRLGPPAPFQQVDLLSTVRRQFRFPSTKLDFVMRDLGLEGKVRHEGHMLWVRCLAGDSKAWARMARYNRRDVTALEELHERLIPWIPAVPNARLVHGDVCPACGSAELVREGFALTQLGKYQRYHCRSCGAWSKSSRRTEGTDIRGLTS